jgi:methyl coenzyme M reductase subunit C
MMVVTLEDLSVLIIIPQNIPKVNQIKVSKIEFWHVAIAKLHKFPTHLIINRVDIVLCVVVMCNKEGIFSIERGVSTRILTPLEDFV